MLSNKNILTSVITIAAVLVIVFGVRCFLIQSYKVSTSAMEEALHRGDYIMVNKLKTTPERNDVVLFGSPLSRDSLESPIFLSRCIGVSGDTIRVSDNGYIINGVSYPLSPNALCRYNINKTFSESFLTILKKLDIPVRETENTAAEICISLTPFEEYLIREELPDTINNAFYKQGIKEYTLVIPKKNRHYKLDANSLAICKEAILRETKGKAVFRDNKLFIDGKETSHFFFKQDYFWMLSDNKSQAIDSRHLGFVPKENIIGTAWFCWMSHTKQRAFKSIN